MDASPAKRRVLGALDPNACSPSKVRRDLKQHQSVTQSPTKPKAAIFSAPVSSQLREPSVSSQHILEQPESRKRRSPTPSSSAMASHPGEDDGLPEPAAKRPCLDSSDGNRLKANPESPPSSSSTTRTRRSASPDSSSVFDTSAATILTEPDAAAPVPPVPATTTAPAAAPAPAPRPRVRLTREQAREKAEILRLRLGLASYKVRTGQTDVPLERLQMLRPHGGAGTRSQSFASGGYSHYPNAGASSRDAHPHHYPGRHMPSYSASSSFPPRPGPFAKNNNNSAAAAAAAAAARRPLPGAPVRRASEERAMAAAGMRQDLGRNVQQQQQQQWLREGGRLAAAAAAASSLVEERGRQQQRQRESPAPGDETEEEAEEEEEEVSGEENGEGQGRRVSEVASPVPRVGQVPSTPGEGNGEDEDREGGDDGLRGGAASGLLSLARS